MTKRNLKEIITELQEIIRKMSSPKNDEYSYIDKFQEANSRLFNLCRRLIQYKGETEEEEAEICLTLLMGYSVATFREEDNAQKALDRAAGVLPHLADSLLKCRLLTYCYGEVYEKELYDEARRIMDNWKGRELTDDEKSIIATLEDMKENEPEWEYI